LQLAGIDRVENVMDLATRSDVDVVCELIGGTEGIAKNLCEATLRNGKSLVTANKALLAYHGLELARLAEENKVALMFEASVGGGIPVIKAVREFLASNKVLSVEGIMNGTCNYILTRMTNENMDFEPVLAAAQELGYAEADPSADVDGADSAHKLAVLTGLAFGVKPDMKAIDLEGLRRITKSDIEFARELGYKIKLLAAARMTDKGLEQRVSPCFVAKGSTLGSIDGVLNGFKVKGSHAGYLTFIGAGAGGDATATAVVSDIMDLARMDLTTGAGLKPWGRPVAQLETAQPLARKDSIGKWYIRLQLTDAAGVLADITTIMGEEGVSIDSLLQKGKQQNGSVPVVIMTHETNSETIATVMQKISRLKTVWEPPFFLRVEEGLD
jgi:homoserine dehydrogenase